MLHLDQFSWKQVTRPLEIIGHVTIHSATPDFLLVAFAIFTISPKATDIQNIILLHLDIVLIKQVTWPREIIGHVTIRSATPNLLIVRFWNFSDIPIGDRDTHVLVLYIDLVSRKQVTWPREIIGHVTIWSATPDFLWVGFGISQISLSVTKLLLQNWSCAYFAWEFPQKREMWLYGIP